MKQKTEYLIVTNEAQFLVVRVVRQSDRVILSETIATTTNYNHADDIRDALQERADDKAAYELEVEEDDRPDTSFQAALDA